VKILKKLEQRASTQNLLVLIKKCSAKQQNGNWLAIEPPCGKVLPYTKVTTY